MDAREAGRLGGLKGGRVRSKTKARAARANARRPRGRWAGTPERDSIDQAKAMLRAAIPIGAARIARLIADPSIDPELLERLMRFASDRAGMPTLQQTEIKGADAHPLVVKVAGGLGWPGVGDGGGGGGGADRSGPRS